MSFNRYLLRTIGINNLDLSTDLPEEGLNTFGISFLEVNRLHDFIARMRRLTQKGWGNNRLRVQHPLRDRLYSDEPRSSDFC